MANQACWSEKPGPALTEIKMEPLVQKIEELLSTIDNLTYQEICLTVGASHKRVRSALFLLEARGTIRRRRAYGLRSEIHGRRWVWRGNPGNEQCERCGQRAESLIAGLGPCCFDSMSEKAVTEWDAERDRRRAAA